MNKQFGIDDIKKAKEVHLFSQDTLYIVDDADNAYGFYKNGDHWFYKENFWDYFESSLMLSYFTPINRDQAIALYAEWTKK